MRKGGFEMAISTVILLVIGLAVLVGLIVLLTKGFGWWQEGTEALGTTAAYASVSETCQLACRIEDSQTFCCKTFTVEGLEITCSGKPLGLSCTFDCNSVVCG